MSPQMVLPRIQLGRSVSDRGSELKRWPPTWMSASRLLPGPSSSLGLGWGRGGGCQPSPLWWPRLLPPPTHWPQRKVTAISLAAGHVSPPASLRGAGTTAAVSRHGDKGTCPRTPKPPSFPHLNTHGYPSTPGQSRGGKEQGRGSARTILGPG